MIELKIYEDFLSEVARRNTEVEQKKQEVCQNVVTIDGKKYKLTPVED